MAERIRETSLAMGAPRGLMIRGWLHVRCAGFGGAIDEAVGLIDEDLDPRGGQSNVGRARLARLAWHGLVHEERSALEMKARNTAEIP
jgi:hypothetical protein